MDIFDSKKRSEIMGRIGGKNTKPEMTIRSILHRAGYRFRLHRTDLPGKPDIVLPKHKLVILVHGCYWHRHADCSRGRSQSSTNIEFWHEKFTKNQQRDKKVKSELQALGWQVLILWQCELRSHETILKTVIKAIHSFK